MNASYAPTGRLTTGHLCQLTKHVIAIADGQRVAVTTAGRGIPLVWNHGIGLSSDAYRGSLSRLVQLGFHVIAIDAPGHGQTTALPRGADTFQHRTAVITATLDWLGVRRALVGGHSMGGRTSVEMAAVDRERIVGALLVDAAIGPAFDASANSSRYGAPLLGMARLGWDTTRHRKELPKPAREDYSRSIGIHARRVVRHPPMFSRTARSIIDDEHAWENLHVLRDRGTATWVLHGERDLVVPFEAALQVARLVDAELIALPDGYHSWMISHPWTLSAIVEELMDGTLGNLLADVCHSSDVNPQGSIEKIDEAMLSSGARLRNLTPAPSADGDAAPPPGLDQPRWHPHRHRAP